MCVCVCVCVCERVLVDGSGVCGMVWGWQVARHVEVKAGAGGCAGGGR